MKKAEMEEEDGNMLAILMSQAQDLDFKDPTSANPSGEGERDPGRLLVDGFE